MKRWTELNWVEMNKWNELWNTSVTRGSAYNALDLFKFCCYSAYIHIYIILVLAPLGSLYYSTWLGSDRPMFSAFKTAGKQYTPYMSIIVCVNVKWFELTVVIQLFSYFGHSAIWRHYLLCNGGHQYIENLNTCRPKHKSTLVSAFSFSDSKTWASYFKMNTLRWCQILVLLSITVRSQHGIKRFDKFCVYTVYHPGVTWLSM